MKFPRGWITIRIRIRYSTNRPSKFNIRIRLKNRIGEITLSHSSVQSQNLSLANGNVPFNHLIQDPQR